MRKVIFRFILPVALGLIQASAYGQDVTDSTMKKTDSKAYGRRLSKKEVREILASGRATERNDLWTTNVDSMFNFYELDDKTFMTVLMFEETGVLWNSYQAMRDLLQNTKDRYKKLFPNASKEGLTFKDMIVSDAKGFESLAPESNARLAAHLNAPVDSLDFSLNSISFIERELNKLLPAKDRMDLFDPYFKLLYAYFGEILRRNKEGAWKFTEEGGMLTSAEIVDAKGNAYSPQRGLVKEFFEGTGKFNLRNHIEAELIYNDMFKR